jgi:hypothetical protein
MAVGNNHKQQTEKRKNEKKEQEYKCLDLVSVSHKHLR